MRMIDELPGFRRRFRIVPKANCVETAVEDDFHHMKVTLHHDGATCTAVDAEIVRAPWTTCPGAVDAIQKAFAWVGLRDFPLRGEKTSHCTHLYDLALLGAAHAQDSAPLVYDILVSDPVDGVRHAEVRRDGSGVLRWDEANFRIQTPVEASGIRLDQLGTWIATLGPDQQEAARLLRWGNMLANGRTIPMERQSDASRMPANCFTFQPHRAVSAKRVGVIRDFSASTAQPLGERPAN